jgi:hypothetical protein
LEEVGTLIVKLQINAQVSQSYSASPQEEDATNFRKHLGIVVDTTGDLKTKLEEAKKLLDSLTQRLVPLGEKLGDRLETDLHQKTDWLKSLKATRSKLDKPGQPNGQQLLESAWEETAGEKNQLIFSDYVDFLSGLALRDKGWDNSICQIADELIANLLQAKMWDPLTIPSSHGAVTLAKIIRMGFPEWTIWGLPLAAHELGLVAVSVDDTLGSYIDDQAGDDEELRRQMQVCLADAFATCTMGPAYACAALLLRFNPRFAYEGRYDALDDDTLTQTFSTVLKTTLAQSSAGTSFDENIVASLNLSWKSALKETLSVRRVRALPDAQRAHIILRVLDKMLAQCGAGASFDRKIIEQLRDEWKLALEQAKPTGELGPQARLDTWVDYLFEYLSANPLGAIYCGIPWNATKVALVKIVQHDKATEWTCSKEKHEQEVKAGNQNVQYLELNNTIELRDVINAAWAYRIERLGEAGYTAEESDTINAAALKLWKCIKDKRTAEAGNTQAVGRPGVTRAVIRSNVKK